MKEYGLSTAEHGDSALVLCKVYRTPRERDHSTASTSTTIINSGKRKAADGDYAEEEDSRPSARPRLAEEYPPPIALRPEPERSAVDEQFRTHFHPTEDLEGYFARKALQEINASSRQEMAAQPEPEMDESFVQSMEQEFPFSNEVVIEEAAPPWEAAAQPEEEEEDAATGLVKTMAADDQMDAISSNEEGAQPEPEWDMQQEFPFLYPSHKNDSDEEEAAQPGPPEAQPEEEDAATGLLETIAADAQMDASLGEEGVHPEPEPDEPAPDEVIYGLPCPAFSPEMILRCSDDVLTPWPSPSSMSMIFDCLY
uniref:Uncharacterized protein n=1 Tax=Avena sativa TaxID=4498 RepID=A0ACD6ABC2_AVESA